MPLDRQDISARFICRMFDSICVDYASVNILLVKVSDLVKYIRLKFKQLLLTDYE